MNKSRRNIFRTMWLEYVSIKKHWLFGLWSRGFQFCNCPRFNGGRSYIGVCHRADCSNIPSLRLAVAPWVEGLECRDWWQAAKQMLHSWSTEKYKRILWPDRCQSCQLLWQDLYIAATVLHLIIGDLQNCECLLSSLMFITFAALYLLLMYVIWINVYLW